MFKQLRKRFVTVAMMGMLIITILVVGTINGINYHNTVRSIHSMLDLISYNGGSLAPEPNTLQHQSAEDIPRPEVELPGDHIQSDIQQGMPGENDKQPPEVIDGKLRFPDNKDEPYKDRLGINDETPFITRFFVAIVDSEKNVTDVNMDNIASFTYEEAKIIAGDLVNENYGYGRDGSYFYLYEWTGEEGILIYLDSKRDMDTCGDFLLVSLLVAGISLVIELIILILLSGKVVKPVVESMEKQKVFITDASHELKTPLTVISANAEVLELTGGKNEWLDSIKNQTCRMTKLVNDMVMLAKLDEEEHKPKIEEFNLSEAVNEVVDAFQIVANSRNIQFEKYCQDNIFCNGDQLAIRKLVSILTDNAVKYVSKEGLIRLQCYKKGKTIKLKVFNTCDKITEEELKLLFDRFYRVDKSRSRQTGGSGIGLSVAKAIVDMHEGMSIAVANTSVDFGKDKRTTGIEFTVVMK